jgi:hypothetical protein
MEQDSQQHKGSAKGINILKPITNLRRLRLRKIGFFLKFGLRCHVLRDHFCYFYELSKAY